MDYANSGKKLCRLGDMSFFFWLSKATPRVKDFLPITEYLLDFKFFYFKCSRSITFMLKKKELPWFAPVEYAVMLPSQRSTIYLTIIRPMPFPAEL